MRITPARRHFLLSAIEAPIVLEENPATGVPRLRAGIATLPLRFGRCLEQAGLIAPASRDRFHVTTRGIAAATSPRRTT